MFFQGTVAEAIRESRRTLKPLIVLLTGFDQGSRQVQDALIGQQGEDWVEGSILLALEDDLSNTVRTQFADAKNFRAFCPVEQLPTVVMVSPSGATLAKLPGVTPGAELRRQLAEAYATFLQQQQRLMAAQATLMAAQAATAAAPAAAAAGPDSDPHADMPELEACPEAAAAGAAVTAAAAAAAGPEPDSYAGMPQLVDPQGVAPSGGPAATAAAPAATAAGVAAAATAAALAAAPAATAAGAAAAAPAPPPDPATVPYRLQFKFTDSATLRLDFTGASLLSEVFAALDEARQQAGRAQLAYVLVQAQPRRVLGEAEEGLRLADAGVQPRTSLQVIPHAAMGHRPPAPPPPAAPEPEPEPAAAGPQGSAAALAADAAAAAVPATGVADAAAAEGPAAVPTAAAKPAPPAVPPPPPPPPAEIQLQVRLSSGESLRGSFSPGAKLAAVLDWIDSECSDSSACSLSQAYPKRTFHSEDLDSTLQELGFDARMSLTLETLPFSKGKAKAGPRLQPAPAAAKRQQQQAAQQVELQVRLSNGGSLHRSFAPGAKLGTVLDWIDAERTDSGPYKLTQPHPKRTFFSGDLDSTLQELGFQGRTSLSLELLPRKAKAPQPPSVAGAAAAMAVETKMPDMFELQFKLTNGEQLRGSFPPEATLQQVCHHLDTHRTDGGAAYALVLPYPRRRFGPDDLPQPLLSLGLQPRQQLLLEPTAGPVGGASSGGGGWSLGGLLSTAASYFNPYAYLKGYAGTPREAQQAQQAQQGQQPAAEQASAAAGSGQAAAAAAGGTLVTGDGAGQQRGARKRALGSAARANIHTLASASNGGEEGDDSNNYWNGNSTEFGGGPPPGQQ